MAGTASHSPVTVFFTLLASPFAALIAPMSILLEMLSRWPRYLSHGPATMNLSAVAHPSKKASFTGDVVRCGFPFGFDQDRDIGSIFTVPGLKSCKDL